MTATNGKPRTANRVERCFDREPPCDPQAEIGFLGSLFLMPEKFAEICLTVSAADFYDPAYGKFFATIAELVTEGKPLDPTLLIDRLKTTGRWEAIGGSAGLSKIINAVPNAAHLHWYAGIVADKAMKRRVIVECTQLLADAYDDRDEAGALLAAMASASGRLSSGVTGSGDLMILSEAAAEVIDGLRPQHQSTVNRAAWGLPSIDRDLGPIMPGEVCVVAARPGVGKTSFAQQVLRHSAMRNRPSMIVSLEMTRGELAGRELARISSVDSRTIRAGEVNPDELRRLESAQRDLDILPLYIWSPPKATIGQIRGMVAHAVARHGVRLAAVDFIQLVAGDERSREDRREQLAEIARGLKRLAKEFSIPLIVLSQINREGEKDNREPTLGMLRECGAIEEAADFVVFLHVADPKDDSKREFIARKVRGAPKGRLSLKWVGSRTEFSDSEACDQANYSKAIAAFNRGDFPE